MHHASMALEYARELLKVDGRRVKVSFTNPESFIPVYGQSEWTIPVMDGRVAYWDKACFASAYSPAMEEEKKEQERIKKEEAKKAILVKESLNDDLDAFYAEMGDFTGKDTSDIFSVPQKK